MDERVSEGCINLFEFCDYAVKFWIVHVPRHISIIEGNSFSLSLFFCKLEVVISHHTMSAAVAGDSNNMSLGWLLVDEFTRLLFVIFSRTG